MKIRKFFGAYKNMFLRKYLADNLPDKTLFFEGWILDVLRWVFSVLSMLSLGRDVQWVIEYKTKSKKYSYLFVDCYVLIWLGLIIFLFIRQSSVNYGNAFSYWLVGLITYRLFEIFQSWVSQFIIGGVPKRGWRPISKYRSLILVFLSYIEITTIYAIFALLFRNNFKDMKDYKDAFYYSVRNAVTIGTNFDPSGLIGQVLFYSQIIFVLLFLTAVIQSIISYKEELTE